MKKIYSITFTIIIAELVIGYFFTKPRYDSNTDTFGRSFNEARIKIGLPIIEEGWVAHYPDSSGVDWMNKSHIVETKDAHHLAKKVRLNKHKLLSEEDSFNKYLNDSVASRLTYLYTFDTKHWDCELSIHYFRTYPPGKVVPLTLVQADSILTDWGLSRN